MILFQLPTFPVILIRAPRISTAITHIVDTLWLPGLAATPAKAFGSIELSWPSFKALDGKFIPSGNRSIPINRGVLDIYLEPVDTATPSGVVYTARYNLNGGLMLTESWRVPTAIGPVTLDDVRTIPPVTNCPTCG